MAFSKPAQDARWAFSGSALIVDPGSGKRETGWIVEIPPVEFFNWWQNNVGNWIAYLDQELDAVRAIQGTYDAIVGASGTHATINAVMADMDGVILPAQDVRIFVLDPQTLTATQVIDKPGVEVVFHPKAAFSKGSTLVKGLQIDAYRVKVSGGRFLNFDETGGVAVELTVNAKNCMVKENHFDNNTNAIDDLGANNLITDNIEEVV